MSVGLVNRKTAICLSVFLAMGLIAGAASAGHIGGIQARNFDNATLTLTLDVTEFLRTYVTSASYYIGVTSGFGTVSPAVIWGDSPTTPIPPTMAPFASSTTPPGSPVTLRAYRLAGVSHTYAAQGFYNVVVNSQINVGSVLFPGGGTTVTGPTPTYSIYMIIRTWIQNSFNLPVGYGTAGGGGAASDTIEIDTVSDIGLLLLALALAATGLFVLRRH